MFAVENRIRGTKYQARASVRTQVGKLARELNVHSPGLFRVFLAIVYIRQRCAVDDHVRPHLTEQLGQLVRRKWVADMPVAIRLTTLLRYPKSGLRAARECMHLPLIADLGQNTPSHKSL